MTYKILAQLPVPTPIASTPPVLPPPKPESSDSFSITWPVVAAVTIFGAGFFLKRWVEKPSPYGPVDLVGQQIQAMAVYGTMECERAVKAFKKVPSMRALPALLAVLEHGNTGEQWLAGKALQKLGEPAIPHLIPLVGNVDFGPDSRVVQALRGMGEAAETALLEVLQTSSSSHVRNQAIYGLEGFPLSEAMKSALLTALNDMEVFVREHATRVLVSKRVPEVVPHLIAVVSGYYSRNTPSTGRVDSAFILIDEAERLIQLGELAAPEVVKLLDGTECQRLVAGIVIERMGPAAYPALQAAGYELRREFVPVRIQELLPGGMLTRHR